MKRLTHPDYPGLTFTAYDSYAKNAHLFGLGGDAFEVFVFVHDPSGKFNGCEWHLDWDGKFQETA